MTQPKPMPRERRDNVPYCRAILKRQTTLTSTEANRAFRRCYDIAAKNLFALDVICTSLLSYEDSKRTAETVEEMLNRVRALLDREIATATKALELVGINGNQGYSYQKTYSAEYSTPYALRYLELIELLDELMKKMLVLRASGAVESYNVKTRTYEWQQCVIRLSGRFRGLADEMWGKIKRRHVNQEGDDANKNADDETREMVQGVMDEAGQQADEQGIASEAPETTAAEPVAATG
jgi:hypothetical protein